MTNSSRNNNTNTKSKTKSASDTKPPFQDFISQERRSMVQVGHNAIIARSTSPSVEIIPVTDTNIHTWRRSIHNKYGVDNSQLQINFSSSSIDKYGVDSSQTQINFSSSSTIGANDQVILSPISVAEIGIAFDREEGILEALGMLKSE
ncbi:hypothetical protein PHJA_003005100 [Phtheirospermum japonicum]|uniref:Uncharacterized protein n=1 Tax=Phtheirospermum japonicum TaxID=374723 RepID=A0A830D9D2_9LAMI|nr:hypothetical protein PHJA_003005100 [Phtheirospermum japonicum]